MKNCPWEQIDDFRSFNELERFEKWMNQQIISCEAIEEKVMKPYLNAPAFKEKWYCHVKSGQLWRLVWPDGPFAGVFERVT